MPRPSTALVRAQLFPRRRWNAKEAGAILKSLEVSGLSVLEFAARYGLNAQRLYRWRSQLAMECPVTTLPFVEIKRSPSEAIEVVLPNDDTIVSAPTPPKFGRARQARYHPHRHRRGACRQVPRAPADRAAVPALVPRRRRRRASNARPQRRRGNRRAGANRENDR